jgi:cysteine-rich repeat protein
VGNGRPNVTCVLPGIDGALDSTPTPDDQQVSQTVTSGANGICQTTLVDDDVYGSGFMLGGGQPFATIIIAGDNDVGIDGICNSVSTPSGDDVLLVSPGNSTPRQVGIRRGANLVLDSTPAGDDVATAMICDGGDNVINSVPSGDDLILTASLGYCLFVCGQNTCVGPGPDDTLQTTVNPSDQARPFISTGLNGILETTTVPDDSVSGEIANNGAPGNGIKGAPCVDAGPDGIAQTDLCGTGTLDPDSGEECDEGGNTATCDSDCTFVDCGDGHVNTAAGEECDDAGPSPTCDANCQFILCGNGILDGGEDCDTSGESATCDDDCTTVACGDGNTNEAAGEECDDGGTSPNDGCNAICDLEFCGDGIIQSGIGEECDNAGANSDTTPDACRTNCSLPSCGDGVTDPTNSEQCDDGNTKNNDDCLVVLGCVLAECGDGFRQTKGTPPFEECDDGSQCEDLSACTLDSECTGIGDGLCSPRDGGGCDAVCEIEPPTGCGNGQLDLTCTAGTIGASCAQNSDCDSIPGDGLCELEDCDDGNNSNKDDCLNNCVDSSCGDSFVKNKGTPPFEECDDGNNQPGDGCSATCVAECGNNQIDGACSEGDVGEFCQTNADCDVSPGDGVCVTEECDTGIDGLCSATPPICSGECTLASCGNGVVECDEQCDLAALNGVAGSGCTATCTRNLIGGKEISGSGECPGAWTLDNPPQDPSQRTQRCKDGASCDFDGSANGACVLSVGICINRPQPASCEQAPVFAVDLLGLKTGDPVQAAAAETLTDALAALTSETADAPGRCREGKKRKNCTVSTDCDNYLGAGDGICDVATGVSYEGPLTTLGISPNQVTACTPGQAVGVPAGDSLRLRLYARRDPSVRSDKDTMRLICEP